MNPILNGTIIDEGNYILSQNKNVNKTFELYKLDYQFFVEEPTHNTFFKDASEIGNKGSDDFYNSYEKSRQTLYGRVNRLSMKLCHNYCETCNQIGISDNEQNCLTCLDNYT